MRDSVQEVGGHRAGRMDTGGSPARRPGAVKLAAPRHRQQVYHPRSGKKTALPPTERKRQRQAPMFPNLGLGKKEQEVTGHDLDHLPFLSQS